LHRTHHQLKLAVTGASDAGEIKEETAKNKSACSSDYVPKSVRGNGSG